MSNAAHQANVDETSRLLRPVAWPLPAAAPRMRTDESTRELRKGETMVVERPADQAVLCTHGALWITYEPSTEGDEAGMAMRVRALTDACVSVMPSLGDRAWR